MSLLPSVDSAYGLLLIFATVRFPASSASTSEIHPVFVLAHPYFIAILESGKHFSEQKCNMVGTGEWNIVFNDTFNEQSLSSYYAQVLTVGEEMLNVALRIAIYLSSMLSSFYMPLDIANTVVPYTEVSKA